ncbi:MAG: hypothetical protein IPM18_03395 [Phycisphaerales bacterium]|nr:hypothetical protein [Phycisphaerales bacterium]
MRLGPMRKSSSSRAQELAGPPLTPIELTGNLSRLQEELHREMKCVAGKNQVYIRSLITGGGTTRPRIALKCHLRRDIGQSSEVFYEHIRTVCCSDPEKCEAYRNFRERHVVT